VSARVFLWIGATVFGVIAASALSGFRAFSPADPAFWVTAASIVVLGELGFAIVDFRRERRVDPPAGARPADGHVDIAAVSGARGVRNAHDPRIQAFQSLESSDDGGPLRLPRTRDHLPLLGRVALVSVFLGRDGQPWSDLEIARAHDALLRAATWVEQQAMRWDAPVNLVVAGTYFQVDDHAPEDVEMTFVAEADGIAPFEARAVSKALIELSRAGARLGFRDAEDWLASINPQIDVDAHVWLLHPRRAGRSMAVPLDQTELFGVSLAVCYAREANVPEPLSGPPFTDPVTIAHELMHLFGASDKYGVPLRSFPRETVSSRDIMRLSESRLSRLRVDRLTASEIGWPVADRLSRSVVRALDRPENNTGRLEG
jgi:hypothetical protein